MATYKSLTTEKIVIKFSDLNLRVCMLSQRIFSFDSAKLRGFFLLYIPFQQINHIIPKLN